MERAYLRFLASSALVAGAAAVGVVATAGPAGAAACEPADPRTSAAVRIDRPRPLSVVSGVVAVTGDVQSLPTDPISQVELHVEGELVATSVASGSDISFRFDWDSSEADGRTTLRVVACGSGAYGAASVIVEVRPAPASTTSTTLPASPAPSLPGRPGTSTTSTTQAAAATSTTIIRPTTTTTTTAPNAPATPKTRAGEDSAYLRAVQPPQRVRRAVTSDEPTPTWPALVTLGGGLVGMTIAMAPGRRWLALLGLGRPGEVIVPDVGEGLSDPPS